jgi:hypothetical protein
MLSSKRLQRCHAKSIISQIPYRAGMQPRVSIVVSIVPYRGESESESDGVR